ncbi:hypothetical protein [Thermodesulfovibrio yellowstonii]|uniref:DUF11 domain-containing protein n=1 Tax=Thermodesulfovibrio yellowstonii (strain ATCC 51303 / DSM 11347 / YP87) TaxID=289376 RepID=B5YK30_THEYD|nr:hypothetical protein [Thermodesulfovibrio yellowstonii]ACI20926.1 hypothetical protein THEYE_A0753 [Thermodesulfovibrio yellowstonii DSM 11347]MDI6865364.1 hypothetical protein [Thermodesulfovibrio yellowstonii]
MKKLILTLSLAVLVISANYAYAASSIEISIKPGSIQANMGDKITYTGTITNNSDKAVNNIIAYISVINVTQGKESPMDLEDWSANKAIKIDSIPPHGTYEGKWFMRLIDSGSYLVYITVVDKNDDIPISSTMSRLEINKILRLNPNNVLPVAIGEPFLIGIVSMLIALRRMKGLK